MSNNSTAYSVQCIVKSVYNIKYVINSLYFPFPLSPHHLVFLSLLRLLLLFLLLIFRLLTLLPTSSSGDSNCVCVNDGRLNVHSTLLTLKPLSLFLSNSLSVSLLVWLSMSQVTRLQLLSRNFARKVKKQHDTESNIFSHD